MILNFHLLSKFLPYFLTYYNSQQKVWHPYLIFPQIQTILFAYLLLVISPDILIEVFSNILDKNTASIQKMQLD